MYCWYIADAILRNGSHLTPCPILYAGFYSENKEND